MEKTLIAYTVRIAPKHPLLLETMTDHLFQSLRTDPWRAEMVGTLGLSTCGKYITSQKLLKKIILSLLEYLDHGGDQSLAIAQTLAVCATRSTSEKLRQTVRKAFLQLKSPAASHYHPELYYTRIKMLYAYASLIPLSFSNYGELFSIFDEEGMQPKLFYVLLKLACMPQEAAYNRICEILGTVDRVKLEKKDPQHIAVLDLCCLLCHATKRGETINIIKQWKTDHKDLFQPSPYLFSMFTNILNPLITTINRVLGSCEASSIPRPTFQSFSASV